MGRQDAWAGDFHDHEHLSAKSEIGIPLEPHEVDYMAGHAAGLSDAHQHAHNKANESERVGNLFRQHGMDKETHDLELKFRESP
jgi:hypothetical protein